VSYITGRKKNIGMFANFKFVLDQAQTPYFMWAAHDDVREKDYLAHCVSSLEKHTECGAATSVVALIDASGHILAEEHEVAALSDLSTWQRVVRYTLMPEGLGKANLMYGVFRTAVVRAVWSAYPQRRAWGQDYVFTLALVSRFSVHIEPAALFKKRLGGYSSPTLANESLSRLSFKARNNGIPLLRFVQYWRGNKEALAGTCWWPLVAMLLLFRLPRSLFVYMTERNYRKFFNRGRTLL
jgi:hypothetical protein